MAAAHHLFGDGPVGMFLRGELEHLTDNAGFFGSDLGLVLARHVAVAEGVDAVGQQPPLGLGDQRALRFDEGTPSFFSGEGDFHTRLQVVLDAAAPVS